MIAVRTFDRFTRPGKKGEQAREFFVLSVQPDITGEGVVTIQYGGSKRCRRIPFARCERFFKRATRVEG